MCCLHTNLSGAYQGYNGTFRCEERGGEKTIEEIQYLMLKTQFDIRRLIRREVGINLAVGRHWLK